MKFVILVIASLNGNVYNVEGMGDKSFTTLEDCNMWKEVMKPALELDALRSKFKVPKDTEFRTKCVAYTDLDLDLP